MMASFSALLGWARARPLVWVAGTVGLLGLLSAFVILGPLSAEMSIAILFVVVVLLGLMVIVLNDPLPIELAFVGFIVLMPATRFSLLESSFSLQANFVLLLLAAFLLAWRAAVRRLPLSVPRSRVHGAVLILFAIIAISFMLSAQVLPGTYRGEERYMRSLKQIVNFAFMIVTYLTVLAAVNSRRMFRLAVWAFMGTSFVVSLYGIYQFVAYPLGWPYVDLFPNTASFGQSSIWAISLAGGSFLRVWSVASEPVWFGDYLVGVIPLAAALILGHAVSKRARGGLLVALMVMGIALLLTFTRSAYLALLIGAIVVLIYRPAIIKRLARVLAIMVGVVVLISLIVSRLPSVDQASLVEAVTERFISPLQDENFGNIHRTTAAATSWEMFKARPWGVGYGNYGFFFYDYRPGWGVSFTDNFPDAFPVMTGGFLLRLLTETSIPGVLAFIWLMLMIIQEGIGGWRAAAGDPFLEAAAAGLLAGFLTLMVRLMAGDSLHFTYQWFFIAMIVAARRVAQASKAAKQGETA